jgi:hypothetical protein
MPNWLYHIGDFLPTTRRDPFLCCKRWQHHFALSHWCLSPKFYGLRGSTSVCSAFNGAPTATSHRWFGCPCSGLTVELTPVHHFHEIKLWFEILNWGGRSVNWSAFVV